MQAAIDGGSVSVGGQIATVEARKGPRGRTPRTAQPTQPQGTSSSIYIRAVEPGVTRDDVAGLFAPYGSVLNTQLRDSVNGRRYAFVQFEVRSSSMVVYTSILLRSMHTCSLCLQCRTVLLNCNMRAPITPIRSYLKLDTQPYCACAVSLCMFDHDSTT
jgi:RNA recognition motif. (a.k.a. RRM, RBD, or RNP domain)